MSDGGSVRASDEDRRRVVDLLVQHAADGRLSFVELEERIGEVHGCRYLAELGFSLRELPVLPAEKALAAPPVPPPPPHRGRRLFPVAVVVLFVGLLVGSALPEGGSTGYGTYVDVTRNTTVVPSDRPPVPPLPAPGAEQPADAEAARQAIRQTFVEAFEPHQDPAAKETAVLRTPGTAAAGQTVRNRYPEAVETTTAHVDDIVFTSATEAAAHFELRYLGGALYGVRVGRVVFVDGRWKVTTETFCEVLAWGGGVCAP